MFGLFKKKPLPPVFPVVDLGGFTLDDLKLGDPIPEHSIYKEHFKSRNLKPVLTLEEFMKNYVSSE